MKDMKHKDYCKTPNHDTPIHRSKKVLLNSSSNFLNAKMKTFGFICCNEVEARNVSCAKIDGQLIGDSSLIVPFFCFSEMLPKIDFSCCGMLDRKVRSQFYSIKVMCFFIVVRDTVFK